MTESFFQPAVTPSQRELACHHFHQHGAFNTSLSTTTTRIEFSDASFPVARTIKSQPIGTQTSPLACRWHCSFFHGSCGPIPGSFLHGSWGPAPGCFSSWVLRSRLWLFSFHHVQLARVSSNLLLTPWLGAGTCFIVASGEPSAHSVADSFPVCLAPVAGCDRVSVSCSKHAQQNASFALLPLELTPTTVFDELLLVTVIMTPRQTRHPPWHRRHSFPASLPASPRP